MEIKDIYLQYNKKTEYIMKRILVLFVSIFAFAALIKADDKPIPFDQLPDLAKTFIKTNFASAKVLYSSVDDDIIAPDYEVILDNGFEIQFKNDGRLESIDANLGTIPESIIPEPIRAYIKANYPNVTYKEYEVGARSYEVKISNGLELTFNSEFKVIEIDD